MAKAKAPAGAAPAPPPPKKGAAAKAASAGTPPAAEKKKRNNNPGVRVQGGRIYDSENGTTCHQCRQKTAEAKASCTACTMHFCPRCLENRYSEKVDEVSKLPDWRCPRCRGECNCSNCRKRAGLEATGILAGVARTAGFGSVSDLLARNPNARALHMVAKDVAAADAAAGGGAAPGGAAAAAAPPPRAKRPKAPPAAAAAALLVDEGALGPRPAPLPAPAPAGVHVPAADAAAAGRRARGPACAWLARAPPAAPLPAGVHEGQLAAVLEFLAAFGGAGCLGLRLPPLAAVAAELVQPPAARRADLLCAVPEDSAVAAVHVALLGVVRAAWGVADGGGGVSLSGWQAAMRGYYAAALMPPAAARRLRESDGPPAVAGEVFTRPPADEDEDEDEDDGDAGDADAGGAGPSRARGGAARAAAVAFPEPGGYWAVPPATRVAMLYELVHDALDTGRLRAAVDDALGGCAEAGKVRRGELAAARREAREEGKRRREAEIAALVAGGGGRGVTLEEQRALVAAARERAEAAARAAAAARVGSLADAAADAPPQVRAALLGVDAAGARYYALACAPALAAPCGAAGAPPAVLVARPLEDADDGAAETVGGLADPAATVAALHARGRREGPLRHALIRACGLPRDRAPPSPPRAGAAGSSAGGRAAAVAAAEAAAAAQVAGSPAAEPAAAPAPARRRAPPAPAAGKKTKAAATAGAPAGRKRGAPEAPSSDGGGAAKKGRAAPRRGHGLAGAAKVVD